MREASPDTVIIADGFSCRSQIADLTGRRALHSAEALALARRARRSWLPDVVAAANDLVPVTLAEPRRASRAAYVVGALAATMAALGLAAWAL